MNGPIRQKLEEQWESGQLSREFMEWNTVERAIKAEIRHKNGVKRSEQARLVYATNINRSIPTTWRLASGDHKHRNLKHVLCSHWILLAVYQCSNENTRSKRKRSQLKVTGRVLLTDILDIGWYVYGLCITHKHPLPRHPPPSSPPSVSTPHLYPSLIVRLRQITKEPTNIDLALSEKAFRLFVCLSLSLSLKRLRRPFSVSMSLTNLQDT